MKKIVSIIINIYLSLQALQAFLHLLIVYDSKN